MNTIVQRVGSLVNITAEKGGRTNGGQTMSAHHVAEVRYINEKLAKVM